MSLVNTRHEAENLISWADYIIETQTDFRRTGALIMKAEAEKYLDQEIATRPLVGVCGRNDTLWQEVDYAVLDQGRIEAVKMMSLTDEMVFRTIKRRFPTIQIITRLYDDRFRAGDAHDPEDFGHRVAPGDFVARMAPIIQSLLPYSDSFVVLNEPNHLAHVEGWGKEDHHARDFNDWFIGVYQRLKVRFPKLKFGYPGLAIPHNDLRWLDLNRKAIGLADFLSVHCYWQTPVWHERNHLSDDWGLRFKLYHQRFPDKIIHITEAGNSNAQSGIPFPDEQMSREYTEWLDEVFKYDYIRSASFFILSSPDPSWEPFALRTEAGHVRAVVEAIGQQRRG